MAIYDQSLCEVQWRIYIYIVVEKYDVTRPINPHRVDAEYGNQGVDFKGAPHEGWVFLLDHLVRRNALTISRFIFGWVNASYLCGLEIVKQYHYAKKMP